LLEPAYEHTFFRMSSDCRGSVYPTSRDCSVCCTQVTQMAFFKQQDWRRQRG